MTQPYFHGTLAVKVTANVPRKWWYTKNRTLRQSEVMKSWSSRSLHYVWSKELYKSKFILLTEMNKNFHYRQNWPSCGWWKSSRELRTSTTVTCLKGQWKKFPELFGELFWLAFEPRDTTLPIIYIPVHLLLSLPHDTTRTRGTGGATTPQSKTAASEKTWQWPGAFLFYFILIFLLLPCF